MSFEKIVDLHIHTKASDGVLSPTEIILKAKKLGICAVGICDHDTVAGIAEAKAAGEKYKIEVIPGVELSTLFKDKDLHILGYFIDFENPALLKKLDFFIQKRRERGVKIVKKLTKLGFKVSFEKVLAKAGGAPIVKPHVALAVLEEKENSARLTQEFGDCFSISSFIESYLESGQPAYVPKVKLTVSEAIKLIHDFGGLAVLAHPALDLDCRGKDDKLIADFKEWGLDGIEAFSFVRSWQETQVSLKHFRALAEKINLLVTGGSDFHGYACEKEKIDAEMGFKNLPLSVDYQYLSQLKNYLKQRKKLWKQPKKPNNIL